MQRRGGLAKSVTLALAAMALPALWAGRAPARAGEPPDPRQAAVLVAAKCLSCHNGATKAGGFDFSRRAGVAPLLGSGRFARALQSGKMPPSGKLPDDEIALLSAWATAGGAYAHEPLQPPSLPGKDLWSLKPLRRPGIPRTPFDRLSANPVDRFVFARLAQAGLTPAPLADRRTLIRRATVDLTGLPPTPEEIDAFLVDKKPGAYERVVDRLLASPAYGERAARLWLDVVRFGESNGYEQNHLRGNAWPYRDWVIRAFESDLPWSRFVGLQLAADVLAPDDPDAAPATGFLVAGIHDTVGIQTEEGTRQQRANDLDDIVSTTGAAFLGLTIGCARCHDHKFDPIPQTDYYRLAAVFAGVRHGERPLPRRTPTAAQKAEEERLARSLETRRNRLQEIDADARAKVLAARGGKAPTRPAVNARRNVDDFPPVRARFVRFTILATNDGSAPCIDELQVFGDDPAVNLALARTGAKATASGLLPGFAIHQIPHLNDGILGNDHSWIAATDGKGWAQIELPAESSVRRVVWSRDAGDVPRFDDRLPRRYQIDVSSDGAAWRTVSTDDGREGPSDYIHPDQLAQQMTPERRAERTRLVAQIAQDAARQEALSGMAKAYIGRFGDSEPVHLLRRGDVMQPGALVNPGAVSCLSGLPADFGDLPDPQRRAALARWIADPKNPLTPRVAVNRLWQQHFGQGLVATSSDFGANGAPPSHPELLDWLATELGRGGGRLKRLHRLMVTSHTYRQSAAARPAGMAKDAGNRLLWRQPLRRMEAEAVRDAILQASGKLDRTRFGPGFRLYKYTVVNIAIYEPLEKGGPETWRRGIYQQSARAVRDSLLGAFDCPESSVRTARRDSTTTALQALALWNGGFVAEQAAFLAERARQKGGDGVGPAFRHALGRDPKPDERAAAKSLVAAQGLPALCRALLNANEFLYY